MAANPGKARKQDNQEQTPRRSRVKRHRGHQARPGPPRPPPRSAAHPRHLSHTAINSRRLFRSHRACQIWGIPRPAGDKSRYAGCHDARGCPDDDSFTISTGQHFQGAFRCRTGPCVRHDGGRCAVRGHPGSAHIAARSLRVSVVQDTLRQRGAIPANRGVQRQGVAPLHAHLHDTLTG